VGLATVISMYFMIQSDIDEAKKVANEIKNIGGIAHISSQDISSRHSLIQFSAPCLEEISCEEICAIPPIFLISLATFFASSISDCIIKYILMTVASPTPIPIKVFILTLKLVSSFNSLGSFFIFLY
jgi:hypothetical protein